MTLTTKKTGWLVIVTAMVALLLGAGYGIARASDTSKEDQAYFWGQLAALDDGVHLSSGTSSLTQWLDAGGERVVGTIKEARPGAAYAVSAVGDAESTPTDFTDPDWAWGEVIVEVETDRGLRELNILVHAPANIDKLIAGFESIESEIIIITQPGTEKNSELVPGHVGQLIGTISKDGQLDFPALRDYPSSFFEQARTLSELESYGS